MIKLLEYYMVPSKTSGAVYIILHTSSAHWKAFRTYSSEGTRMFTVGSPTVSRGDVGAAYILSIG